MTECQLHPHTIDLLDCTGVCSLLERVSAALGQKARLTGTVAERVQSLNEYSRMRSA